MIRNILTAALGSHSWIVIVALGAAIAGLVAWGAVGRADRDRAVATADAICAAAGTAWRPAGADDDDRGKACRAAVADLAAFKVKAIAGSANALAKAVTDSNGKNERNIAAAADAATRAAAAARRMETADAKIPKDDRVDGDWFAALNDAAGLRP